MRAICDQHLFVVYSVLDCCVIGTSLLCDLHLIALWAVFPCEVMRFGVSVPPWLAGWRAHRGAPLFPLVSASGVVVFVGLAGGMWLLRDVS